ncbi:MAG TPA: glycoside hydrolase family 13 protein [Bacteroidales bacterium]|nr:glycoside hydrolase family 13 protein [Bacteroidales bacterium]
MNHNPSNLWIKLFFFALCLIPGLLLEARTPTTPAKVEPPFWWADMYHEELQIMVYGKDIALTRVEINQPGVTLREVVKLDSPNYLFLYLDLSDAAPSSFPINFFLGRRLQHTYNFELRQREEGSRYRKGFDASDAIYLLMPDRFSNGNTANDNIPGMLEGVDRANPNGRQGGDIQGIRNHLGYLHELGFTALWMNPVYENNQPRYSYHGYAITDFYKVDPRLGTIDDFVGLVKEARAKGMDIIKDMIFNHSGDCHWWMADLPAADWLNHWPEFTRTSYRMSTIVDPWAAPSDHKRMVDGWFDTHMPDLNQRNRHLAIYLKQNSVWWIEHTGITGIRKDTQPYPDKEFMSDWGKYVMSEYPNFNIVGEAWSGLPAIISYFQGGKKNHDAYDSHIPSVFDFAIFDEIGLAFEEQEGWNSGLMRLYNALAMDFLYANPFNLVIFGDNHDTDRFFTRVGYDIRNLKMALTFLLTTRGIPQIYTGTELLKAAYERDGHGKMRSPFPGGWPGDPVNAFTPQGRNEQQNQVIDLMRTLLRFRKNTQALHFGRLMHFVPENNVYVYFRYDDENRIMVVMNNNDQEINLNLNRFREGLKNATEAQNLISGDVTTRFDVWNIPAKSAQVYIIWN